MYQGEFLNNEIDGRGRYEWKDGKVYEGQWSHNLMHGFGILIFPDGNRYEGEFVKDRREGRGKYFWKDGRVYDGEWKDWK